MCEIYQDTAGNKMTALDLAVTSLTPRKTKWSDEIITSGEPRKLKK